MLQRAQVRPATPSDAQPPAKRSTCRLLTNPFELTVEWTGNYSVEKALALLTNSTQTSNAGFMAWLLATPITALTIPLLLELLPLNDPLLGWHRNLMFFLRTTLRAAAINYCFDSQVNLYIPEQRLPKAAVMVMLVFQGLAMAGVSIAVSAVLGIFPIPFTIIATAPFHNTSCWIIHLAFSKALLPVEKDPITLQRIQQRLPQVMKLIGFPIMLLYLYNSFAAAFSQVPENYQVAMAVLLQLVKLLMTRAQWSLSHIGSRHESTELDTSGDLATAHVASGARFFHALFTTTCLQKSKSLTTLAVMVCFSLLQELGTMHGLRYREQTLELATEELSASTKTRSPGDQQADLIETLASIAERARRLDGETHWTTSQSNSRRHSLARSVFHQQLQAAKVSLRPGPRPVRQPDDPLTTHETAFLARATSLLQCQETVLLRLYVEIFVPILYFTYVVLVQYTPNIEFLPTLKLSDVHALPMLSLRLSIQVAVKLISLGFVLGRHCRQLGGLSQVIFAISSMRVVILGNCLLNALWVFDFTLLHNGHDFTFHFTWLRRHS